MMKGLPYTGSHPAQMGIGVSYCGGFPKGIPCSVCVVSKQAVRGLARVGLKNACGETKTRCRQFNERKSLGDYRKVCRKYLQDKLLQGM
jgi:hypothetical protein